MATRFYTDPTNTPSVSPGFIGSWDDDTQAVRRKLVIDAPGSNGSTSFQVNETAAYNDLVCVVQFVSEPLDSISATLSAAIAVFRCLESDAKANCYLQGSWGKCDSDGGNATLIADHVAGSTAEFAADALTNRRLASENLADQVFSQGDRLIFEVGASFIYEKVSSYTATISVTDNSGSDLVNANNFISEYNSWIETGDTFTVASGEPAAIKLGPMFTFA